MMGRVPSLLSAVALLLGGQAIAAPVAARLDLSPKAGAQLRLDHWPAGGWAVQQFQRNVEIRFPGVELEVTQQAGILDQLEGWVFSVDTEVRAGDSYLRIVLSCDCGVSLAGSDATGLDLTIVGDVGEPALVAEGPAPESAPVPIDKRLPPSDGATVPSGQIDAEEVRERLLEQLRRAAEAGIVDLADGADQSGADGPSESSPRQDLAAIDLAQSDGATPRSAAPRGEDEASASTVEANLTESAPQGVAEHVPDPIAAAAPTTPKCYPPEAFMLPETVGQGIFSEAVAAARARLVGEFDRAQADAAMDLTRIYLSATAGAEARATLTTFGGNHELAPLYAELADLVMGHDLPPDASLLNADCQGPQALWRAFAQAQLGDPAGALASEAVAGRALDRLPLILRNEVAAALGLAAADESDWTAARRFEALAERAALGAQMTSGSDMLLSARIAQWHGDTDRALEFLKRARDEGSGLVSDKALIALADLALASELALDADTTGMQTDLASLAYRMRGTALGAKAFDRQAHLHLLSSVEEDTVDFVNEGVSAGLYPPEDHAALLSDLVSGASLNGLSRPLALVYLDDPGRYASAIEQAPFRRAVVRSLADIGVPGMSVQIVRPEDLRIAAVAVPLGQAYLATGDARAALDVSYSMDPGAERDGLAAAALALLGQDPGNGAPSETREVLEAQLATALEADEMDAALAASLALLGAEPDLASAERVALIAIQAGADELPREAAAIIGAQAPDRLPAIQALFSSVPAGPESEDPVAVAGFLESLDAEISLIEGYLEDG